MLVVLSLFFLFISSFFTNVEAFSFSLEPHRTACIRVYDGGRQSNGQQIIRFYSTCPQDMYINVCVKDDRGDVKLYKSTTYIKTNGTYTVFTFPNSYPRKVQWTTAAFNPEIPPLCNNERTKPSTFNAW